MRHHKSAGANRLTAPQQNVQIKRSGSIVHADRTHAAVQIFKPLQLIEKLLRGKRRFHCAHRIDVVGPRGINRRSFVERTDRDKLRLRQLDNLIELAL